MLQQSAAVTQREMTSHVSDWMGGGNVACVQSPGNVITMKNESCKYFLNLKKMQQIWILLAEYLWRFV